MLFLLFIFVVLNGESYGDHHLWNEFDNKIISVIMNNERNYEPCPFKNGSCFSSVIKNDLKLFQTGLTKDTFLIMKTRFNAVHYQLINHTLYRDENCNFPTRCAGIEYFLRRLANKLNDFDIMINVADYPLSSSIFNPNPVFSFSKTDEFSDIMYPAWSFWSGGPAIKIYPTGLGRWDLHYVSMIQESENWPWSKKNSSAFFRGSRTNSERDALILLSRESPNLVDASYTINQGFKSYERDTLGAAPADVVKMEQHCRYKYLFNFRGVTASFRFKFLFLCRSLVFHVGDDWKEFFYSEMKPWIHYVPLPKDHTKQQIRELLEFFIRHDDIAKRIADRGFDFVRSHLKMDDIVWYWETLLKEYTKLLRYDPTLDADVIKL